MRWLIVSLLVLFGGCNSNPSPTLDASTATCTPVVLASWSSGDCSSIAVDTTSVYYAVNGTILRVPIDGGQPVALAENEGPYANNVVVDGTNAYWDRYDVDGGGAVRTVSLDGGVATTLAQAMWPQKLAIDKTSVYWTDWSGDVMKVDLDGGAPVSLASGQTEPSEIAVDANNVYWTTLPTPRNVRVMKAPLTGGAATQLASLSTLSCQGFAVDATSVYWTAWGKLGSSIGSVQTDGANLKTLADSYYSFSGLAVDPTSVYWGAGNAGSNMKGLMRVAKNGGTAVSLVSDHIGVCAITTDATNVYWTNMSYQSDSGYETDTVMKCPK